MNKKEAGRKYVHKKYGYLKEAVYRGDKKLRIKIGRTSRNRGSELSECGDKIRYESMGVASERLKAIAEKYKNKMTVYTCRFCGGLHIGRVN